MDQTYIDRYLKFNTSIFTCNYENEITGICCISLTPPNTISINFLCVPIKYRNRGISTIILNKIIEIANINNFIIDLEAIETVEYYKKFGFEVTRCTTGFMEKHPNDLKKQP